MTQQQKKGADQTEKPTPKKIRDARKEGNVHKSRELTSTVLVLIWLVLGWMLAGFMFRRLQALAQSAIDAIGEPFATAVVRIGWIAIETLCWLAIPLLAIACFFAVLVEFLQVGPVLALKRLKPDLSRMNPAEGMKKMFSQENLVELVKSIIKTAALTAIFVLVLWRFMPDYLMLPFGPAEAIADAQWQGIFWIGVWTVFVFFFISVLDAFYQRFVYVKNLRMSRRDIKQEVKESEGDPLIKAKRRQLHQEWAQQNMLQAARTANVVVTNPTHIAIALTYEDGKTDLPVVSAKGEDFDAELIKQAAEEAGVPIMRNVELARGLSEKVALDDYISSEFFEAVAQVLFWAEGVRRDRSGD